MNNIWKDTKARKTRSHPFRFEWKLVLICLWKMQSLFHFHFHLSPTTDTEIILIALALFIQLILLVIEGNERKNVSQIHCCVQQLEMEFNWLVEILRHDSEGVGGLAILFFNLIYHRVLFSIFVMRWIIMRHFSATKLRARVHL